MARDYQLTWEANGFGRWKKEWKKQTFRIAVSDLPIPESEWTKEKSYPAALIWWERTKAKLVLSVAAEHPLADDISRIDVAIDFARRTGDSVLKELEARRKRLESYSWEDSVDELWKAGYQHDEIMTYKLANEKATRLTVGAMVEKFVNLKQQQANSGLRTQTNVYNIKNYLKHFTEFMGKQLDVNAINGMKWEEFYSYVLGLDYGHAFKKQVFGTAREVLQWAKYLNEEMNLPSNLNNKNHKFARPAKVIDMADVSTVKQILGILTGQSKLLVMLAINTGYTVKDMSDLKISEVDLKAGTITRKRSKMNTASVNSGSDKGIVLTYKLWPETVELMKQQKPTDSVRYFSTLKGNPLISFNKDIRTVNCDYIWKRLRKKGIICGWARIRRTVGNLLRYGNNRQFYSVSQLFMGHKSDEVIDVNYAGQATVVPDDALQFLRQTFLG